MHPEERPASCSALDESERKHTNTGKGDGDEETIGNEFTRRHDPNLVV
jgi:hypothetical protein